MHPSPSPLNSLLDRLLLPGAVSFTRLGYAVRCRTFAPLGSLAGRHVVITGATAGLGLAASRRLASLGATLTIVGRDRNRLSTLVGELTAAGTGSVAAEVADLSLLHEVRALAKRLHERNAPIHVLVNNAGALFNDYQVTEEGFERTLALNLLSPFLLTQLLMPRLTSSAPARILTVSSGGMYLAPLDVDALLETQAGYNGSWRYALAKRAQVALTSLWAEELSGSDVDAHTMHPGWADTKGLRESLPLFHRLTRPLLRTTEEGADTIVFLCAGPDLGGEHSGGFWFDRELHPRHVLPWTAETAEQRRALWLTLTRLTAYGDSTD
jgi:NAD(P)-dependent dehydrogenase (short-subunit alcohol dehydrogenase family)